MKFRKEVNSKNEIRVWDLKNPNENDMPFLFQPNWPDGTAWKDKAEAEAWADLYIESRENPNSEYLPGNSPKEPKRKRPEPSSEAKKAKLESTKAKLTKLGLDEAEVQTILGI